MKRLKYLLLLSCLTVGIWFPACEDGELCPAVNVPAFFDVDSINLRNLENTIYFEGEAFRRVKWADYRLQLGYLGNLYGMNEMNPFSFSMMPKAYACSIPLPGFKGSEESLESIHIINLKDFDSQYLAGDTINAFTLVKYYVDDAGIEIQDMTLEEFLNSGTRRITAPSLEFGFSRQPMLHDTFQAEVHIRLDNGEFHKAISKPIIVAQ